MSRRVLAFECQYCGALKRTKYITDRHETACTKNPEARNCIYCVHSEKRSGEEYGKILRLWCSLRDTSCTSAMGAICQKFKRKPDDNVKNV
jgi:hypothetical protein